MGFQPLCRAINQAHLIIFLILCKVNAGRFSPQIFSRKILFCELSGSRDGDYENGCFLGCCAV
jgi:hypothetical protein